MNVTINWKRFIQVFLLLNCLLYLAGCTMTWVSEAQQIISILGPAASAIISLLTAVGVRVDSSVQSTISSLLSQATGDLNNIVVPLLNEYQNSSAAAQGAVLDKIEAAVKAIQDNFNAVMSGLHIADTAVQQRVMGMLNAFAQELVLIGQIIPVLKTGGRGLSESAMAEFHSAVKRASAKNFAQVFNEAGLPTGDAQVDSLSKQFAIHA